MYWDINNLYGWAMSQNLAVDGLSGLKIYLNLRKISSKAVMKKVMKDIFFKLMFNILKYYMIFIIIYPFYLKE